METLENLNVLVLHYDKLNPTLIPEIVSKCDNPHNWHKFVITNIETYNRNYLLKTIIDFVYPHNMIPVKFSRKNQVHFMARNCLDAILMLVANSLNVPNPMCPDKPLKLIIIANHLSAGKLKIDVEENINHILRKRLNESTRTLDLSNFHNDLDLQEFCMLSQPKLLRYILHFATKLSPKKVDLSNNFIKAIDSISLLSDCDIEAIDLKNNEIASMDDLEPLKDFKKLEIIELDGNPLCSLYDQNSYISNILKICPNIRLLDNTNIKNYINTEYGCPNPVKNFLCSYNGGDLVNQFVEYYFSLYDVKKRNQLKSIYHENVRFSITVRMIPNQRSCSGAVLGHYRSISRNLYSYTSSFGNKSTFLFQGRDNIIRLLASLPHTNHDPLLFQCDLILYEEKVAILIVHGVFREESRYLGFTRNFVLEREEDSFLIINEQLHVYNALDSQIEKFGRFPPNVQFSHNPLPYFFHQYHEVEEALHLITDMNHDYSQRFLERYNYDFTAALNKFMELYINNEIPKEAFNSNVKREESDSSKKQGKYLFSQRLAEKTLDKHPEVVAKTVWDTLNTERITASLKPAIGKKEATLPKQKKLPLNNKSSSEVPNGSVVDPYQNITFPIDPLSPNQQTNQRVNLHTLTESTDNQNEKNNESGKIGEPKKKRKRNRKRNDIQRRSEIVSGAIGQPNQSDIVPAPVLLKNDADKILPAKSIKQEPNGKFNELHTSGQPLISTNSIQSSSNEKFIRMEPAPATESTPNTDKNQRASKGALGNRLLEYEMQFNKLPEELKKEVLKLRPKDLPKEETYRVRFNTSRGRLRLFIPRLDK